MSTRPDPATFAAQLALAAAVGWLAALVIPAHIPLVPAPVARVIAPVVRVIQPVVRAINNPPATATLREVRTWPASSPSTSLVVIVKTDNSRRGSAAGPTISQATRPGPGTPSVAKTSTLASTTRASSTSGSAPTQPPPPTPPTTPPTTATTIPPSSETTEVPTTTVPDDPLPPLPTLPELSP